MISTLFLTLEQATQHRAIVLCTVSSPFHSDSTKDDVCEPRQKFASCSFCLRKDVQETSSEWRACFPGRKDGPFSPHFGNVSTVEAFLLKPRNYRAVSNSAQGI